MGDVQAKRCAGLLCTVITKNTHRNPLLLSRSRPAESSLAVFYGHVQSKALPTLDIYKVAQITSFVTPCWLPLDQAKSWWLHDHPRTCVLQHAPDKCDSSLCFCEKESLFTKGFLLYEYTLTVCPRLCSVCMIHHRPQCQLCLSDRWVRALEIIDSQEAWLGRPPNTGCERAHIFVLCLPKR